MSDESKLAAEQPTQPVYVQIGLNTSILPVELSLRESETEDGQPETVLRIRADRWATLDAVLAAFESELKYLREDVAAHGSTEG